jgi:RNA ligase
MDKRDGSMINPVIINGQVLVKSKKSFTSDVAILAQAYIDTHPSHQDLCKILLSDGYTPTFEYTSPKARIVLNYGKEELVLLHVRHNITGEYLGDSYIRAIAETFDVPVVDTYSLDNGVHSYLDNLDTLENMEGYIFQFENQDMVKAKCKWYLDLHHSVTFLSERRVAEMVLDETIDDFKSYLADTDSTDSLKRVEEIETQVSHFITLIEIAVEEMAEEHRGWIRKDFAIKHHKHPLFGMVIKFLDGREPDYKEYYRKNLLKDQFGLDQV